jgi:hypothetical protein
LNDTTKRVMMDMMRSGSSSIVSTMFFFEEAMRPLVSTPPDG